VVEVVRDEGVWVQASGGAPVVDVSLTARWPGARPLMRCRGQMDRLGRDAAEQLALLKAFRAGKVGWWHRQQIDLATPTGGAMAQIGAVFAELERCSSPNEAEALTELRQQGRACHAPSLGHRDGAGSQPTSRTAWPHP